MGSVSTKRTVKDEYLRLVEKQKVIYAQTHPDVYSTPRRLDWRMEVLADLREIEKKVSWAFWPGAIIDMLSAWDIMTDEKWKSNLLWHDYLRIYQQHRPAVPSTTRSTLSVPLTVATIANPTNGYLSLLDFLKANLKAHKSHAIAAMISTFSTEFFRFYTSNPHQIDTLELAIDIRDAKDAKKIVLEVHLFIDFCLRAFAIYYKGVDLPQLLTEPFHDIRDLIIEEVLTEEVSAVFLSVFDVIGHSRSEMYRKVAEMRENCRCSDLGISPQFCLDTERPEGGPGGAYGKAIAMLKTIENARSPCKKLAVIVQSAQTICECVDEYWGGSPNVETSDLIISPDQTLSIYIYILLKSRLFRLGSHLSILQEFLRKDHLQSAMGYYLATLEASLEHITEMGQKLEGNK